MARLASAASALLVASSNLLRRDDTTYTNTALLTLVGHHCNSKSMLSMTASVSTAIQKISCIRLYKELAVKHIRLRVPDAHMVHQQCKADTLMQARYVL